MTADAFAILPLTPQRLHDFLDFFDHRAFSDNPKWQSCYCHFPHADHARVVWKDRSAQDNRAATCSRIDAGTMRGWLAYADGLAVGWCNAGPRRFVEGLFDVPEPMADRIGAISCFVVAPAFRGQRVATRLLEAACAGLRELGLDWAEAYPLAQSDSATENHYGPLAMYMAAGFERVASPNDSGGNITVRKALGR